MCAGTLGRDPGLLISALHAAVGPECVVQDELQRQLLSCDAYAPGVTAAIAIRPSSRDALRRAVRVIAEFGYALAPRGGGMSYTGGYTPVREDTVLIDLSGLDRIVEISEEDMIVTVEPGVTWKQLYDALQPMGLRLPFFGTFSGAAATVGGGMSNGALFMGSARYGTAVDMALGFEIVTATGDLLKTGQGAFRNGRAFYRTYGPDLTGLFIHDAGALGIKSLITMRLIQAPKFTDSVSFAFSSMQVAARTLSIIARASIAEDAYIFDPATTSNNIDELDLKRDLHRLSQVIGNERNFLRGIRQAFRLVRAGRKFTGSGLFSLHVVCAGRSRGAVQSDLDAARVCADQAGGFEIANSIPKMVRATPFEPVNSIVSKDGARWVALNAKIAHSKVDLLQVATDEIFARYANEMKECKVTYSRLCIAVSNHAFSFEPVLHWHDEWLPLHRAAPESEYLRRIEEPAANVEARKLVSRIREDIVALFAEMGLASNQIGKTYPWLASLETRSVTLVRGLKKSLDPMGLMNPGALGFD